MVNFDIVVREPRRVAPGTGMLAYLESLSYDFRRDGNRVWCVLTYAQPHPEIPGTLHAVAAADSGYEGIACVDDTARAALLALKLFERSGSHHALTMARRWLTFVDYMQYPDGSFANFIRNTAGVRNASGPTSYRGGFAWSARALWALAAAYRLTGEASYLASFRRCRLAPTDDHKMNAVLALAKMELYRAEPSDLLRDEILAHCHRIIATAGSSYFRNDPVTERIDFWGYHQLHAVAAAAALLDQREFLAPCRHTVRNLLEADVRARFWRSYPSGSKDGVCAYMVSPIVQGLAAMYRATAAKKYRDLALQGAAWFYGRNDARTAMYDPTTGRCRDGITDGIASENYGAESSIEAGFAELERQALGSLP